MRALRPATADRFCRWLRAVAVRSSRQRGFVEGADSDVMTSIQPELWVDQGTAAIAFYQ
jgi:hypothetical protein